MEAWLGRCIGLRVGWRDFYLLNWLYNREKYFGLLAHIKGQLDWRLSASEGGSWKVVEGVAIPATNIPRQLGNKGIKRGTGG